MPKTNKHDKQHLNNLKAYERAIDRIYLEAIRESVALRAALGDIKPDKPFSFDDYPNTRKRVERLFSKLKKNVEATIVNGITAEWELANGKNDELVRLLFGVKADQLPKESLKQYFGGNTEARQAFIERAEGGLNLSQRVWKYTEQFKSEMEMGLDLGIREGKSADDISRDLRKYLQNPDKLFRRVRDEHGQLHLSKAAKAYHPGRGVYRSSYKNARRLTATETNIAYRTADHLRWQSMDFVVGIKISLSNNHTLNGVPFTDICDDLKGKYPKDFKFVGWHPLCRCFATPILKTQSEIDEDTQRILNGEEPTSTSKNEIKATPKEYQSWLKANEERIKKAEAKGTLPYFLRDNEKYYKAKTTPQEIAKKRHEARTPEQIAGIQKKWNTRIADVRKNKFQDIVEIFEKKNIEYKQVYPLKTKLSEKDIIERLAGGDLTKGSCSSLALAYAGNKCGLDVIDYRGGNSRWLFSDRHIVEFITQNVGGIMIREISDYKAAKSLFSQMAEGKEYYFCLAEHAAIIRKVKGVYEYLEMQDPTINGFTPFTPKTLKLRFNAKHSRSTYGRKYSTTSMLVDINLFKSAKDFDMLLGYMNTDVALQQKGIQGRTR